MIGSNDVRVGLAVSLCLALLLITSANSPLRDASARRSAATQETAHVRDSAGVRIVESVRPAWPRGKEWLLAAQPSAKIGEIEGAEYEALSRVVGAVRMSDGSIAIGDGSARRVRVYDRAGKHLISFGGSGGGPGQFDVIGAIGRLRGDSIGVWDLRRKRVTVFSRAGQPRVGPPATVNSILAPAIGWVENGSLVVTSTFTAAEAMEAMRAQPGEARAQQHFIRVHPDGRIGTVLVLRGQEQLLSRSARSYSANPVLFGRNSYLATTANGLVAGENDTFEFRRHSIIRKPGPARKVTAAKLSIAQTEAEKARQQTLQLMARGTRPVVSPERIV